MNAPKTIKSYTAAKTEAVISATVELAQALQPYRNDFVLRGGLAEYLLLKGDYCGADDIDLSMKAGAPTDAIYEILTGLGYYQPPSSDPKRVRYVEQRFGITMPKFRVLEKSTITLDFVFEPDGSNLQGEKDAAEYLAGGIAVPLDVSADFVFCSEMEIGPTSKLNVLDLVGLFISKTDRIYPKIFYDIYMLTQYGGGPKQAAQEFKRLNVSDEHRQRINEAINEIANRFRRSSRFSDGRGAYDAAWMIESFDKRIDGKAAVKHVNRFIQLIRDDFV
jgi:hypothetical protein